MLMANKNQDLKTHLLRVAELSSRIIERISINEKNEEINKDRLIKLAYYSGLFHDIGKVDKVFQDYFTHKTTTDFNPNGVHIEKKGFSFEDHPRHNEISWFLIEEMFDHKMLKINKTEFRILKNVILWHHSSPIRKFDFTSSNIKNALKLQKKEFEKNLKELVESLKSEDCLASLDLDDAINDLFSSDEKKLINYKSFFTENSDASLETMNIEVQNEAISSLLRSVVTTADRYVSANGLYYNIDEMIESIFEENKYSQLIESINKMEKEYYPGTERTKTQLRVAEKLSYITKSGEIAILNAPAGAGKTKVALHWAKESNANKIYYIVPRTIIAEEIFDELKKKYLKHNVSFEIVTGEKQVQWTGKKEVILEEQSNLYKSDIVITTIDQLIKSTTTHKNVALLQDILLSNVIFDEYHEYYKMSGLDLLFTEIIKLKSYLKNTKTLIMSATPNYFMLENLLGIHIVNLSKNMVSFETINKKDYRINYCIYEEGLINALPLFLENEESNYDKNEMLNISESTLDPFYKTWDKKKTIVISNTATMAQKSYIINLDKEDALLAHAKLKQDDKQNILKSIKNNFSTTSSGKKILRAGPIVQASLNITSERLITDLTSPEKTLQRLGRLNRFGEDFKGDFIIAVPSKALDSSIKAKSDVISLLSKNNEKDSTLLWLNFIMEKISNNTDFKLSELYSLYKEFYAKKETIDTMKDELKKSLEKSYANIRKNLLNPIDLIAGSEKKAQQKILAKNSLRGKSYNSKMAVYEIINGQLFLTNDYVENISMSRDLILMYDEKYDFIKETVKKHEILFKGLDKKSLSLLKKAKKEKSEKYYSFVLDLSRKESFNIYTSFSKNNLTSFNLEKNKDEDYVYVKTKTQNIGYLRLKQLTK